MSNGQESTSFREELNIKVFCKRRQIESLFINILGIIELYFNVACGNRLQIRQGNRNQPILVCLSFTFIFNLSVFNVAVADGSISESLLGIAGKSYLGCIMWFVFLLILNIWNNRIINRITDFQIAWIKEFRFLIKHPVAISPQIIITCRESGREGESIMKTQWISTDLFPFYNRVGTVDKLCNDEVALCIILMCNRVYQISLEPYFFSCPIKGLVQM